MKKMQFLTLFTVVILYAETPDTNKTVLQYSAEAAMDWHLTYDDPLWSLNYLGVDAKTENFNLRVGLEREELESDTLGGYLAKERFFVEEVWGYFPVWKAKIYWGKMPLNFGGSHYLIHPSENYGISKPLWFSDFLESRYHFRMDFDLGGAGPLLSLYLNNGNKGNVAPPKGTYGAGARLSVREISIGAGDVKFGLSGFVRQDSTEVPNKSEWKPYRAHYYGGFNLKADFLVTTLLFDLVTHLVEEIPEMGSLPIKFYLNTRLALHDLGFLEKLGNPAFSFAYELADQESRALFAVQKMFSTNTWMKMETVFPLSEGEKFQLTMQAGFNF